MSDDEAELLGLLSTAETNNQEQPASADESSTGTKGKKEKKSKKDKKKEKKKAKKKESGKRRSRRDDETDEDDIIDFDNIETSSDDDDDDGMRGLIADAASSGDDDDDDDVTEEEDAGDDADLDAYRRPEISDNLKMLLDGEGGEVTREVEERWAARAKEGDDDFDDDDYVGFDELGDEVDTTQFTGKFMPSATDARVYAVRIRGGFSRLLVNRLVNKCNAYKEGKNAQNVRQDLGILSVFSLPHVAEFIYVEAHRESFVQSALAGLDGCFRFRITELGTEDVLQLFTAPVVGQLGAAVKVGELLRVRSPLYRMDLGEVIKVLDDGRRVMLRLVPRVDFVGKMPPPKESFGKGFGHGMFGRKPKPEAPPVEVDPSKNAADNNDDDDVFIDKTKVSDADAVTAHKNTVAEVRPPQRLFNPAQALGATKTMHGQWAWGRDKFDADGFLLREFTVRQLFVGQAKGMVNDPTIEELRSLFSHDNAALRRHLESGKPADAALQFSSGARIVYFSERFRVGDPVKIVKGQLAGVKGKIVQMQPGEGRALMETVVLSSAAAAGGGAGGAGPQLPQGQSRVAQFTIDLGEACKMFEVGDQISVERGPSAGDTGVVLTADGSHIEFYSDTGKGHCTAEANDCTAGAAAAAMPMQLGAWRLFDLVRLVDDRTVGLIVSLGANTAELLTDNNAATRVPLSSIKNRVDSRGQRRPTDAFGNQIFPSRELAVEVLTVSGAPRLFAGKVCHVKAVYEDTVFVRANDVQEHSGIGAVSAKVLRLQGGNKKTGVQSVMEAVSESRSRSRNQQQQQQPPPQQQQPQAAFNNAFPGAVANNSANILGANNMGMMGISMESYTAAGSGRGGKSKSRARGSSVATQYSTQWN